MTLNITSWTILTFFGYVRIKSFDGVCMAKKLLISSKLVMKDPPGAIMLTISPLRNLALRMDWMQCWRMGSVGGRDVTEKQQVLANNATKDTVKVASSPDVDEHVVVAENTKGIEVGNVGQGLISNIGFVSTIVYDSPNIDNFVSILSWPTS
nr:hypothetical protein [Tanacetum cinerariifolium]